MKFVAAKVDVASNKLINIVTATPWVALAWNEVQYQQIRSVSKCRKNLRK